MANPLIVSHSDKPAYAAGGLGAMLGAMALQDWLIVVSILSIAATYFTNLYFRLRDDRRKAEEHELRMEQYEDE